MTTDVTGFIAEQVPRHRPQGRLYGTAAQGTSRREFVNQRCVDSRRIASCVHVRIPPVATLTERGVWPRDK
jgi:hypothetical protein